MPQDKSDVYMKIAIVGAGGLGSKFGARLSKESEVVLLHHDQTYVDAVNDHGLVFRGRDGSEERIEAIMATSDPATLAGTEVAIVTVKSYDTESAISAVAPYLAEDGIAITFQNGLGNVEAIARKLGASRSELGVTTEGGRLIAPGKVADGGVGESYVSCGASNSESVRRLVDSMNHGGLKTSIRDDVDGILWAKLAMVAGINSVAAVLGVPNGSLSRHSQAREICIDAIREVMSVADLEGVELAWDPIAAFDRVTKATRNMPSGTLIDVLRGRQTEIDSILGEVVLRGQSAQLPMHVTSLLLRTVKALEATHRDRIDRTSVE